MARPLRIEYAGALYHVTARGNARQDVFLDDGDRTAFLACFAQACERNDWLCHVYCLMSNHYHLLIETASPTLARGMRHLNGTYTQGFNRRHHRVGHVFQGRYQAVLVEKQAHLLELARYVVLNPVRAGMVRAARDWPWSSYRATVGFAESPEWLCADWLLGGFGQERHSAREAYRRFVSEGKGQASPWGAIRNQIYLGSEEFIADAQCQMEPDQPLRDIPRPQKRLPAKPLSHYAASHASRNDAMAEAYRSGDYSQREIGEHFGVSYATVSRAVKAWEAREEAPGR